MSFDTVAENRAFSEKFNFNFPLLSDTDREMGLAYGACFDEDQAMARRIGVVIDADGKIAAYQVKVHPKEYAAKVLATL